MQLVTNENAHELQDKLWATPYDPVGFDTECHGPRFNDSSARNPRLNAYRSQITGFSVAFPDGSSYYVPVAHVGKNVDKDTWLALLDALLSRPGTIWVHNVKFELQVLQLLGYTLGELILTRFRCTQVLMWLLEKPAPGKSPYGLKTLVKHHFLHEMTSFEDLTKGATIDTLPSDSPELLEYACEDAVYALKLGVTFEPQLAPELLRVYHDVESRFVYVLRYMEQCGFAIDAGRLTALAEELSGKLAAIDNELNWLMPGVNIRSDMQLRAWGFDSGRWPLPKGFPLTEKTQLPSLTAEGLEMLLDACEECSEGRLGAELLLARAEYDKLLSTYTTSLVARAAEYPDGRLHSEYGHTITSTGRLSSSKPNLQNIPVRTELGKRLRECFVAEQGGTLFSADYSQIELRVLGHLAGGKGMLARAYQQKQDIHQQTADLVGCSRSDAKTVNFLIVYGGGANKLAKQLGCSVKTAKGYIDGYLAAYPEIAGLKDATVRVASDRGYIKTLLGRRKNIPELHSDDGATRSYGKRIALNIPCQGGARDVMVLGMVEFFNRILERGMEGKVKIVAQVHDDLVCECPLDISEKWASILSDCLSNAYPLKVPLVAESVIGTPWSTHK